eukprot:2644850-Rhodomonas_salina.2
MNSLTTLTCNHNRCGLAPETNGYPGPLTEPLSGLRPQATPDSQATTVTDGIIGCTSACSIMATAYSEAGQSRPQDWTKLCGAVGSLWPTNGPPVCHGTAPDAGIPGCLLVGCRITTTAQAS